jgi:uncharacterized protein (TIGR03083 family)
MDGMGHDYDRLRLDEMADISAFAHGLTDDQWDHPSLCDGWRVRDVISHMCVGYTTPMLAMIGKLARRRFDVPAASKDESIAYGSAHTPAQLLATYDRIRTDNVRMGITRVIKPAEGLVDHVIHHSDIRRPLGFTHQVPEARLVATLDAAPTIGGFLKAKGRAAGLKLVATDAPWSWGDGPDVTGPGEALLLALGGRTVALDELGGEGLGTLRAKIAA